MKRALSSIVLAGFSDYKQYFTVLRCALLIDDRKNTRHAASNGLSVRLLLIVTVNVPAWIACSSFIRHVQHAVLA